MIIAGKTDKGIVRGTNQDDFAAGSLPGGAAYVVVCDGMGGANGGNVASSTAVKIISNEITQGYSEGLDEEGIKKLIETAIDKANTKVFDMSQKDPSLFGMGTTVVAAIVSGGYITVANAGDSRAYLIEDSINQLTHDHSIVQEMVENGKITSDEALVHPQKNIITRALGVEENLNIDFCRAQFGAERKVLICTDGLTNLVTENDILAAANESKPDECVEKLVKKANDNGGIDNVTVVVIYNVPSGGDIDG